MSSIQKVVYISIALVILATVLPMALFQIYSVDTTNWNPAVATIFTTLIPLLAVLGLVLRFMSTRRGSLRVGSIVQLAVVLLILAVMFPIAMNQIYSMPTATTISGTEVTLPETIVTLVKVLLPIIGVLSIAFAFLKIRGE